MTTNPAACENQEELLKELKKDVGRVLIDPMP
jgi:hypothetical protein